MKSRTEQVPRFSELPGLYRNKNSDSIWLIDISPPSMPGMPSTGRFTAVLLLGNTTQGVKIGTTQRLNDMDQFEPFTGRLILENDK